MAMAGVIEGSLTIDSTNQPVTRRVGVHGGPCIAARALRPAHCIAHIVLRTLSVGYFSLFMTLTAALSRLVSSFCCASMSLISAFS
jgi:hypothetical protein